MARIAYSHIYRYDERRNNYRYCYWITPAKFRNGLFDASFFETPVEIPFEDTTLLGSARIREYLEYRYGDYMQMPSEEARRAAIHAYIFDTERDYTEYLGNV